VSHSAGRTASPSWAAGPPVIRVMQEDTPGGAATCLRGPLRRACALFLAPEGRAVSDLSRLGRIYQGKAARLLERYRNARAQGQFHSLDYMIVKDLAHTYPTATGREMQRAMIEGVSHIRERTSWHLDDDTRRTVRKAWERPGAGTGALDARGGGPRRQPGPSRHRDWTGCGHDAGGPAAGARRAKPWSGHQGRRRAWPLGGRP